MVSTRAASGAHCTVVCIEIILVCTEIMINSENILKIGGNGSELHGTSLLHGSGTNYNSLYGKVKQLVLVVIIFCINKKVKQNIYKLIESFYFSTHLQSFKQ